jgi:phage-related protein
VIIIAAIVALVAAFIYAYKHSQKFRDIVDQVIDNVQHAFKNFMHAVDNVKHAFDNVWHAGENFIHAVENIIHAVGNFIHAIGNLIHAGENVGHALGNVVHFFTSIPRYIEDAGKAIVGFFTDLPSNILKLLYQAPTWLINAGIFLIKGFFTGLLDEWKLQVKFFTALPGLIIKFFANAPTWLLEAGKFILKGLLTGLKIYWEIVKFFYWSIPKFILKIFVSAGSWLVDAGRRIIGGLFSGIKTAFLTVAKWWLGLQLWVLRIFINAQVWLLRAGAAIISGLWHAISGAWNSTVGPFFANVGSAIVNKFANAVNWLITAGHNVISGIWNGMGAVWASVKTWLGRRKQAVLDALGDATKWLYSVGRNVITGLWNGIKALGTWLKDQILKIVPKWIKDALGIHSIPGWAVDIGKWIARGLAAGIKKFPHFISNLAKMARDKLSNIGIGSGFDIPKLAQGLYQQYAASLFAAHGWAKNQLAPLVALWQGESGWNPKAKNPSSGAYGIPQSLPASKMDSYGDRNDPAVQIRWGLDYIKGAYGTPSNAWAQWQARSPHWYHQGAWEIPRDQFAFLQRKEMVVPAPAAEKWRANQEIDYERLARVLAKELGRAMSNVSIELDGAQVATSVTKRQGAKAAKGPRR